MSHGTGKGSQGADSSDRGKYTIASFILATINTMKQEIFVYNRQVINTPPSTSTKPNTSQIPIPSTYEVKSPPDTIADQNDLQAWRDLFMARRSWALKLVDDCVVMSDTTQQRYSEIDVITRSVGAAVVNLQTHVQTLDHKCADARKWASEVSKDHQSLISNWEGSLAQLRSLPATAPMVRFIVGHDPRRGKSHACLEDLVDVEEVKKASEVAFKAANHFKRNVSDLGRVMDQLVSGTDQVSEKVDNGVAKSALQRSAESIQLIEDIEAIAKKVSSDYENILGYPNNPKSVSQASKSALLHTKNFLPNLRKRSLEMDEILRYATSIRNQAAVESVEIMHAIADLNSMCTEVSGRVESLEVSNDDENAFRLLQLVDQLPFIYASFVAEAIRRREWNEKIKNDSSTLANEMAAFQDEEDRRRKKWQKSTGALFWSDKTERKAMGLEVNLLGDDEQWPMATRQDLEELLEVLQTQGINAEVIGEVSQVLTDLNSPTKQQSKRTKAFKAGSFHEATLGRSALLVRGDDDIIRTLQEEKAKIQGKLKGSESRVRRLEDLLHRQSVVSRSSSGNVFQVPTSPNPDRHDLANPPNSPRIAEQPSGPSSFSLRRFSANQGTDEKAMAQRLISLEAELIAERKRASGLEKEVSSKNATNNDIKGQVEEANSTKRDLMENLEAQQREFAIERQSLETEIKRFKAKIEEYEDDMDRIIGSRENEKAQVDERVRLLQQEFEKLRAEAAAETQRTQGQVDFLRNDAKLQRESNESLERQLLRAKEENKELNTRAKQAESSEAEQLAQLQELYSLLIQSTDVPDSLSEIIEAVCTKSRDMIAELADCKRDLAITQHDRDTAQSIVAGLRSDIAGLRDKLSTEEMETFQLRETLAAERAKFHALESELSDEREQLSCLRAKFADGETGSEALRSRVKEEERKATMLSEELAERRSQVGSLEEELRSVQERLHTMQARFETVSNRFEARTLRAKDLTQRLYTQNDRLYKLLDRLSYSVTREGNSMIIQKIPKTERVSANESSDPGSSMRRSLSGAATKSLTDSADLGLLYWMQNDDAETESEKYDGFLKAIGNFDMDAFNETITKRVKDVEYTARKYTKDARAYREKSHHAQKEAHEKIAFKNFKEGDLALFLPTRNQVAGAWAAFNVGAPHYFLREQDSHKLRTRDWLLARIQKIEDRVVDLSKSMQRSNAGDRGSIASNGGDSFEDDNPFDLSDGLRWYLIDAAEEKPGAPSTPGLGKSTVATTSVDATGSIRQTKKSSSSGVDGVSKTLSRSLDSRRSSSNSKKAVPFAASASSTPAKGPASISDAMKPPPTPTADRSEAQSIASTPRPTNLDIPQSSSTPPIPLPTAGSNFSTQEVRNPTDDHHPLRSQIDDLLGP
jgi:autophagy-related protein 11